MSDAKRKPMGYWNYEKCKEEALKYTTRGEFQKKCESAYRSCLKNGWTEELFSHMIVIQLPKNYMNNYNRCKEVALLCNSRSEFKTTYPSAYYHSNKNKWLNDICEHMIELGNEENRCIYACVFKDKHVYVGLTYDITTRQTQRENDEHDPVTIYSKKSGLSYDMIKLTDYIDKHIASELEGTILKMYTDAEWISLNRAKTGALGGSGKVKWTFDKCKEISDKCNTRTEFSKSNPSAYHSARRYKWLDKLCSHMKPFVNWDYDLCKEEALKYTTRKHFRLGSPRAYSWVKSNNYLDLVCSHMPPPLLRYTFDICQEEALKYTTINDFYKNSKAIYSKAMKMEWLSSICNHMICKQMIIDPNAKKPNGYWDFEHCKDEAMKYTRVIDFKNNSSSAYNVSYYNGWLAEFFPKKIKKNISLNFPSRRFI